MESEKIISLLQDAINEEFGKMCNSIKNGNEIEERIHGYSFNRLATLCIVILNSDDKEVKENAKVQRL